jgi:hypothetical protein
MAIGGYYVNGYWWLLVIIVIVAIGDYFNNTISDYSNSGY